MQSDLFSYLVRRHDPVEESRRQREGGDGGEEPRVALLALLHVEPRRPLAYELGPLADLLRIIDGAPIINVVRLAIATERREGNLWERPMQKGGRKMT